MLSNFINDGGFGMYPTMLFGALALASAVAIAFKPERRFLPAVIAFGITTFASGLLGTVMGIINTLRYVARAPETDRATIVMIGAAESLNNMVLALIVVVLTALIASVAAARVAMANRAQAPA
jgi:hypothetical protein